MSAAGVQSWTLTAADNTTINGINIAENCPAANINNAIRQAMSSVMQELVYQGADISASVSMSLAGVDFRFMDATGSASIVHVGTGRAGLVRNVLWNSRSTLVGSANIINDGGGNIITATNDFTVFTSLGSGAWRARHSPANGISPAFNANITASATTVDSILLKTTAGAAKLALVSDVTGLVIEVGTFTPGLKFGGASVGMTGTFSGRYKKIGTLVTAFIDITLTAKGSSTGNATITAMPFTSAGVLTSGLIGMSTGYTGITVPPYYLFGTGATSFALSGISVNLNDTNFSSTTRFCITVVYETS